MDDSGVFKKYALYGSGDIGSADVRARLNALEVPHEYRDIRGNMEILAMLNQTNLHHVPQLRTPCGKWVGDYDAIMAFLDTRLASGVISDAPMVA